MAESIGLASGLLTLAAFAFNASVALYETIQSFQFHSENIAGVLEELEALSGVLDSLAETIRGVTEVDFSALRLPLRRCGRACQEFEEEIKKCLRRSSSSRTSFRDWAKLKYMGEDISSFQRLLAAYKSTIMISLTDANLRKSSVTAESLKIYKDLLKSTTDNLEDRILSIDQKLETILERTMTEDSSDATELGRIQEERISAQKCLQICAQLTAHINKIQLPSNGGGGSSTPIDPDALPQKFTMEGLQECKSSLTLTATKLEGYMKDLMDRVVTKSGTGMTSDEELADLVRLREEWETTRKCRDICAEAESHLKENISIIDNYAVGDAVQFMVSTDGQIINGRNRGLGWRTRQIGGHIDGTTLQKISQDMLGMRFFQHNGNEDISSHGNSPSIPDDESPKGPIPRFKMQYGPGYHLSSDSTADTNRGQGK
ncbi:hypothetical protein BP6252_11119 [Coleophoma cylindrospora]|uniref:Azaphilone pigments biosynthesis cluster protein L N-terminal domain-containing protein n=1 Tax=Coleophoma cylindrospora TaxID=1849047 RepID=A0A3D8QQ28_9HELO|nr:hypothetical protein BP6252_11119 [Coleophoma cylindrospora]